MLAELPQHHPLFERFPAADQLNRWSGKWNCCVARDGRLHLRESILAFANRLERIVGIQPQTTGHKKINQ
jgi:hypothetical protein